MFEMCTTPPRYDAQFLHRCPCQGSRRKRELKAGSIIEKKQTALLFECVKLRVDL